MRLSDVLALPKQTHSLSIIKDFLAQSLSHQDHQAALSHYFDIALSLNMVELVYDEGKNFVNEINLQEETSHQEKIIKHLIDASLQLNRYEKVEELIELRKEKLPILKQYLAMIDQVLLKKSLNLTYLDDLYMIMSDTIPDDIKIYCLKEIYEVYQTNSQHQKALDILYRLYQFDLMYDYEENEYNHLVALKRYEDVMSKAQKAIKENHVKPAIIIALLESYIAVGDHHKAINLEADYESYIDGQNDDIKLRAYECLVDLYTKENNKLSLNIYQKKLKSVNKQLEKKEVKPKAEIKEESTEIKIVQKPKKTSQDVFQKIEIFQQLLLFSHQIDFKLKLRDYLRLFFIEIEKYYSFKEVFVYLETEKPNFYFYKKERLYDKTVFENDLKETMVLSIHHTGDEIFDKPNVLKYQKNLISNKPYEEDVLFVYGFPIGDLGVFMVHMTDEIKDPALYYDDFKWISNLIYTHILDEKHLLSLKKDNTRYEMILQSALFAYRLYTTERSIYNELAQKLLGLETYHHLELFLRDVSYDDVRHYQTTLDYLMTHPNEKKDVLYHYQNKTILETMVSLKVADQMMVVSTFIDQSQSVEKNQKLIEQATLDHQTGLLNIHALTEDLDEHLKDKSSLMLIELGGDLKHIYGGVLALNYFKEFGQLTKKYFKEGTIYRKDFDQLLVILPFNDIRAVTKLVKDYFKMIHQTKSIALPYEKFSPQMTILRYPVVTSEKKKTKLLHFLDIGLEKVKRQKNDDYDFFIYRDYEEEVFEQQVIHYLNEAIENHQLSLVFNQITDVKKNKIWQYESELSMPNLSISNHYLLTLAKKRHRLVDLEFYHIKKVCEFLVELEKQTERLIKITIPISKETFIDSHFNPFLLGLLRVNQIPHEFIRLKLDMEVRGKYASQILELIDQGLSVDTTSLNMALTYPVTAFHYAFEKESLKTQAYMSKLKDLCDQFNMAFIIRQVKTKEQKESIERLGISYIEGPLYKQLKADLLIEKIKDNI